MKPLTICSLTILVAFLVFGCRKANDALPPSVCKKQLDSLVSTQNHGAVIQKASECLCIPGIDSADVLAHRAYAFFRKGQIDELIKDEYRITQVHGASCSEKNTSWEGIGYFLEAKFDEVPGALLAYQRGVESSEACNRPDLANLNRLHRAQLFSKIKRFAEAIHEYESVLATGDTSIKWIALGNLMHVHLEANAYLNCIRTGREVQAVEPFDKFQNYWMASAFDHLGQHDSAFHYYHRAAEMGHPKSIDLAAQCPAQK